MGLRQSLQRLRQYLTRGRRQRRPDKLRRPELECLETRYAPAVMAPLGSQTTVWFDDSNNRVRLVIDDTHTTIYEERGRDQVLVGSTTNSTMTVPRRINSRMSSKRLRRVNRGGVGFRNNSELNS